MKLLAKSQIQNQANKENRDVDQLSHVDHVTTNAHSCHGESLLYILEDNEAVIKIISKGTSPTMRHESRTHRVALDRLFDRINLDAKIQIKYVDAKHQLADILTKGNFTRDEWDHLLRFFNIKNLPVFSCGLCHVQESSGNYPERRVGSGEAEAHEFGIQEPLEYEERSFARVE